MEIPLLALSPTISTTTTPHHYNNFYYSAPTTPIHTTFQPDNDDDFAFDFSGPLDPLLISYADELFHCGRIKTTSFSRKKNFDYFIEAFHQTLADQTQPTQLKHNSFTKTFYQTRDDKTQLTQNPPKRGTETPREKDTDCLIETFYQTPDSQTQPTQKKSDYFTKAFYQTRGDKTQLTQNPPERKKVTTREKNSDHVIEPFYQTHDIQTYHTKNPPTRRSETTTKKDSQYKTFYQTHGDKTQLTQNPTTREKNTDCFIEAFYRTPDGQTQNPPNRGREATAKHKRTRDKPPRSSSPFRVSDILAGEYNNHKTWYNKWSLKNLFRITSEGSAVNKYPRIRRADGCRRKVSAHEMHYTANRVVAEMRRKTYLPYKSGLLGCLVTRQRA